MAETGKGALVRFILEEIGTKLTRTKKAAGEIAEEGTREFECRTLEDLESRVTEYVDDTITLFSKLTTALEDLL